MADTGLYLWAWLQTALHEMQERTSREDGAVGMEYAVVAAVVIVVVAGLFGTVGKTTISSGQSHMTRRQAVGRLAGRPGDAGTRSVVAASPAEQHSRRFSGTG